MEEEDETGEDGDEDDDVARVKFGELGDVRSDWHCGDDDEVSEDDDGDDDDDGDNDEGSNVNCNGWPICPLPFFPSRLIAPSSSTFSITVDNPLAAVG